MASGPSPDRTFSGWRLTEGRYAAVLVSLYAVCIAVTAAAASEPSTYPIFVVSAFVASGLVVLLWRADALSMRHVLIGALLGRIAFFPLLPSLSDDVFRYVWDGMLQADGLNPFLYLPSADELSAYQDLALYDALNSADYYSVYPPLSQLIFALGGLFADGGWHTGYYVIKSCMVLIELGGVWCLTQMLPARAVLLYAWQPLVLLEVAGQAHTEAAMVGLLLAAIWAARRNRGHWAAAALAGAGMVKLYPFVLFPLLWRRFGAKVLVTGAAVSVGIALPYAAPEAVGNMLSSLRLYVQLFEFNAGPYYAVKEAFAFVTGQDWSKQIGPAMGLLFVGTLPLFYWLDARRGWRLEKAAVMILGAFFALSTTVHPWYLISVVALAVFFQPPSWHWIWLATLSLGTYLFYVDGPYWSFVMLGWTGLAVIANQKHFDETLQWIQQQRAIQKARRLDPILDRLAESESLSVLDLGAGEGYVGAEIQRRYNAHVQLADVVNFNRTPLPHVQYDGEHLPFDDEAFDVTVLYFVLHHCEDAERVLDEALRVSQEQVIVVESVYESRWQHRLLQLLDVGSNRLRSAGKMTSQEKHLNFREAEEWLHLACELGAEVTHQERFGGWVHRQFLMVLEPRNM